MGKLGHPPVCARICADKIFFVYLLHKTLASAAAQQDRVPLNKEPFVVLFPPPYGVKSNARVYECF